MTTIYCPKCETQTEVKAPCKRCKRKGVISRSGLSCTKCKGRGFNMVIMKVYTELVFVRNQDPSEPSRWQCPKCGYRLYLMKRDSTAPEVQLPLIAPELITSFGKKNDKDIVGEYITRRFGK